MHKQIPHSSRVAKSLERYLILKHSFNFTQEISIQLKITFFIYRKFYTAFKKKTPTQSWVARIVAFCNSAKQLLIMPNQIRKSNISRKHMLAKIVYLPLLFSFLFCLSPTISKTRVKPMNYLYNMKYRVANFLHCI